LEQVADLLDTIGREFPGSTLVLICDRPLQLSSLQIEFHSWNPVDEATWLASADIGISWLPDDDWSRGKCGLKLLQYMAAGLPVLANPVGVQREMVLHGQNGYLVESPDDWLQAIACLGNSASLRQRMGQAAREWVEARYSFQTMRGAWRRLLNRLDVVRAA
jgi:glycosyltransferase involved in cell wall biosynthesis